MKSGDILLCDEKNILANVLYGPAKQSTITLKTKNALYLAWGPVGLKDIDVANHLHDLLSNLEVVYGSLDAKITIL